MVHELLPYWQDMEVVEAQTFQLRRREVGRIFPQDPRLSLLPNS